jgi:hypothetical protein
MLKTGRLHKVENLDQKFGAAGSYYAVLVTNVAGRHETLLFTDGEIAHARYRVKMNPEDEVKPNRCDRLLY